MNINMGALMMYLSQRRSSISSLNQALRLITMSTAVLVRVMIRKLITRIRCRYIRNKPKTTKMTKIRIKTRSYVLKDTRPSSFSQFLVLFQLVHNSHVTVNVIISSTMTRLKTRGSITVQYAIGAHAFHA